MNTIRNFRSLGGIKTALGTTKHRLFRGGPLDTISVDDQLSFHQDYKVDLVLDLRSQEEREHHPNRSINGVYDLSIELMDDNIGKAADPKEMMHKLMNHDFKGFMLPMYESFITSTHTLKQHKKLIELLVQHPNSSYFHCSAGKDRTGYTAALILRLLGADYDTVMQEYLLTNNQPKKDTDALLEATRLRHGHSDLKDEDLHALIYVTPEYLDTTFETMNKVYGSFESYVENGLKLEYTVIESLRAKYLD